MSRDYKSRSGNASEGSGGGRAGALFLGIFIGLIAGLIIALAVTWYVNKMPNPFAAMYKPADTAEARPEQKSAVPAGDKPAKADKPRFDFYKILPGKEEPATEQEMKQAALKPQALKVFKQDAIILKKQIETINASSAARFASTETDGLGKYIWHLLKAAERGETAGAEEAEVEQDV